VLVGASRGDAPDRPVADTSKADPSPQGAICHVDGAAQIEAAWGRWVGILEADNGQAEAQAEGLIPEIFVLDGMSERILDERWAWLNDHERTVFRTALTRELRNILLPYFQGSPMRYLRPADEEWVLQDGFVTARYWLMGVDGNEWFTFRLAAHEDGGCGVLDVRKGSRSLLDTIERRVDSALEKFSFSYMIAELGGYDRVVLEDFEDDEVGTLPRGWSWKGKDDDKHKPYRVQLEDGNKYLEATDEGQSVIMGRDTPWNVDEFPYVSFRVRVNVIPEDADERDDWKVDSAAGLYFTLNSRLFGQIPQSLKYVWSSTLPVGTAVRREGIGKPWQIVFGTGTEGIGEWHTFVFDARQAFRQTFGSNPPTKSIGFGILSDANSMKSQAYADYDDIVALREAPPGVTSGVLDIVDPITR
jgi:hypothetical protein